MSVSERGTRILDELYRSGGLSVDELCKTLGVSVITVRRELAALEQMGRLRRTHGGAVPIEPLLYEPFRHDSSYQEQIEQHAEEKRRIARAAAELVKDDQIIALTAGTTTTQVTRSLPHRRGVTVITNAVNMAMELSKRSDLTVFVTGGFMRGGWFSLVGNSATHAMSQVYVDIVFIGVNGIDAARGLTALHPEEAAIDSTMIRQARQKVVVADHSKLGRVTNHVVVPTEEVDLLITDTGATDEQIEGFVTRGIEVRRV